MLQPPRNLLLNKLSARDLADLTSFLTPICLPAGLLLEGEHPEHVTFPDCGVVSRYAHSERCGPMSVSLVGCEGIVGLPAVLGGDSSFITSRVLVPGQGRRIEIGRFRAFLSASAAAHGLVLAYAHVVMTQLAEAALSAGRCRIDGRLARCLLMLQDRVFDPDIFITHDGLAGLLGVRRPGVTDSLHRLEGDHLIRSTRNHVIIENRQGLEALAGDTYGTSEREYLRLFGNFTNRKDAELALQSQPSTARSLATVKI